VDPVDATCTICESTFRSRVTVCPELENAASSALVSRNSKFPARDNLRREVGAAWETNSLETKDLSHKENRIESRIFYVPGSIELVKMDRLACPVL
jgi:hypothetical protein